MIRNNTFKVLTTVLLAALVLPSCMKDNTDELKAKEKELLNNYIITKNITVQPRPSGLYYIETAAGTGDLPVDQDLVIINYTIKGLSDDVRMTTIKAVAQQNQIYNSSYTYGPQNWVISLGTNGVQGLNEGLTLMRQGGKATLITPSEIAFKQYGFSGLANPYETLVWDVEMVRVVKDPLAYEQELIHAYMDTVKVEYDSTSDGIIKITDIVGGGDLPATGTTVKVNYTLYLINGLKVYGTTSAYAYAIGNNTGLIPGWDKAMRMIKAGEECRVILPYLQAYGKTGQSGIPPCTPIIYKFERIE